MKNAPVFDIDLAQFTRDPYPVLAQLRKEAPIAFVPQLNGVLFTRRSDIVACEKNISVFSSHQPQGLMNLLMGHNMMRKDGQEHTHERKMLLPSFSPKTIKDTWKDCFKRDTDKRLNEFDPGQQVDLFSQFAMPVSADALKTLTGLTSSTAAELDQWSQQMIDGVSNYHGDPEIEERCKQAIASIDAAIDERIPQLLTTPDASMLSVMLQGSLAEDSIKANIKLAISGGQNEPRDAIAGAIWALLTHPEQLDLLLNGETTWDKAFEEYLRWLSPIGMSPRRIAKEFHIDSITLEPEDRVFFMFNSANRDEEWFDEPDEYRITRDSSKHIGFGAGPHFCIAAAASRTLASDVALPMLFDRFPKLKLDQHEPVVIAGWAFRGIVNLPVTL